jgi:hypothetical protein
MSAPNSVNGKTAPAALPDPPPAEVVEVLEPGPAASKGAAIVVPLNG